MITHAYHSGQFAQADFRKAPSLEKLLLEIEPKPAQSERDVAKNLMRFFAAKEAAQDGKRKSRTG